MRSRVAVCGSLLLASLLGGTAQALAQSHPPATARAQAKPRPPFQPGSIEIDAGGLWATGIDFGSTTASLRANQTPAAEYPLFKTASQLQPAPALETRIGVRITAMIGIEGAFQYSRPSIETRITGDVENAASVTASIDISRYIVEVSGVVHLTRIKLGTRGTPFVLGGVGYLRELDETQAQVETGRIYHAGGGVKYLFTERQHGLVKGLGVRADARVCIKDGGFDLEKDPPLRPYFAGGASLVVAF